MDFAVIANNFKFLILQGLIGIGPFIGGTLRLAIPAILLGFVLGIFVGLARLAQAPWIRLPATAYVEFFRGVALTAFVIFEAAYFGEIVRAGVQSVPRGQVEAATALGMTGTKTMTYVVMPQALRNMVPSLVTQMIVLFKDTSLASIIGYVDLTKAAQIVNNREIRPFELYLFIAV